MAAAATDWALLPDDITRDIFSRLRPSEPRYLFRVSHLCKDWLRALTDPDFLRRLHERQVAPLPLGFLQNLDDESVPAFVRTIDWPFSPTDVPERRHWKVLDYRHGRAMFLSTDVGEHGGFDLLVWDPISGDRRHVSVPPEASRGYYPGAALVCAAPGCNHRPECNAGPFQVAFIANPPVLFDGDDLGEVEMVTRGFIYSSEMESWIEVNSTPDWAEAFGRRTSVLVGHSVYFMSDGLVIFEFDLAGGRLSVIPSPDIDESINSRDEGRIILMVTEDGGLGMAEGLDGFLYLWSWETTGGSIGTWVQTSSRDPYDLCLPGGDDFDLIGFAEGANTIFMRLSDGGIFTFELSSEQGRTVLVEAEDFYCLLPVVSFYATHNVLQGPGGVQRNLPNTSMDDGDEGIEREEKALELAQQMFDRGSDSIEQMDFVNAVHCLSQSLDIRVGYYGKLATECATTYYKYGCALLYKSREVTDRIGNVHKETANEESVKGKDYDENSKASGTNGEDAPSLKKVNSDEVKRKSNGKDQEYGMIAGDQDGSDLELSWEMLDIARKIVEKSPDNTADMVHILCALAEVTIERGKKESNSEHNVSSPDTDPEAAERGAKRATYEPISREPSPKRHAEDPKMIGKHL